MGQRFLAINYSASSGFVFSLLETAHNPYHLHADLRTILDQGFQLECYFSATVIVPWPNHAVAFRVVESIMLAVGLQALVGRDALTEWLARADDAPVTPS